ncbi:hypothetical protein EVAR_710_1 [Eumeta japonica]|uniref:Uncharacterized protein n=1 Tax=Eumeta variegata TaxID=151549 RepID=A0A4C1SEM6_EUMVA|nr:hypothetical protein EVAR_710_1 [Eumeta japonica]
MGRQTRHLSGRAGSAPRIASDPGNGQPFPPETGPRVCDVGLHSRHSYVQACYPIEFLDVNLKGKNIILEVQDKYDALENVTYCVKTLKWKWAGYMMRSKKDKWAKDVIEWCSRDQKRKRGRQRRRWENIKKIAGITWARKTQNRMLYNRPAVVKERFLNGNHELVMEPLPTS